MHLGSLLQPVSPYRRLSALVILVTSIALPFVVREAAYWHAERQALTQRLSSLAQVSHVEEAAHTQLARWQSAQAKWALFADEANRLGWGIGLWDQHNVQVDGKRFSRQEADVLLSSLSPGRNAFMIPETFSIKLMDPHGSLLVPSRRPDRADAVTISLQGTYYSRSAP